MDRVDVINNAEKRARGSLTLYLWCFKGGLISLVKFVNVLFFSQQARLCRECRTPECVKLLKAKRIINTRWRADPLLLWRRYSTSLSHCSELPRLRDTIEIYDLTDSSIVSSGRHHRHYLRMRIISYLWRIPGIVIRPSVMALKSTTKINLEINTFSEIIFSLNVKPTFYYFVTINALYFSNEANEVYKL